MPDHHIKILYVAHEGSIDGSNTSLRLLVTRLKATLAIQELILVPTEDVAAYYRKAGLNAQVLANIYTIPLVELDGYGRGFTGGIVRQFKGLIRWKKVNDTFAPTLKSFNPDIVHLNEIILVMHARSAHNMGYPVIMHDRAAVAGGTFGIRHSLLASTWLRYADAIVAICPSYVKRLGRAAAIAHVVHNPFDTPPQISSAPPIQEPNIRPGDRCKALLIGARPEKGLYEAIQALKMAQDCTLRIIGGASSLLRKKRWQEASAGGDTYHQKIARWLSNNPEVGERVDFLGATDGAGGLIAESDVVLIPWTTPHFARPLIEAWLMKKPVIAAAVDGLAEYCKNNVNSLVFPAGDIKELANALTKIAADKSFAKEVGNNGYASALEFIGKNDGHLKILDLYRKVLASHKSEPLSR